MYGRFLPHVASQRGTRVREDDARNPHAGARRVSDRALDRDGFGDPVMGDERYESRRGRRADVTTEWTGQEFSERQSVSSVLPARSSGRDRRRPSTRDNTQKRSKGILREPSQGEISERSYYRTESSFRQPKRQNRRDSDASQESIANDRSGTIPMYHARSERRGKTRDKTSGMFIASRDRRVSPVAVFHTWMAAVCALGAVLVARRSESSSRRLFDSILYEGDMQAVELGKSAYLRPYGLQVEIFSAPKPFEGDDADHQRAAIATWLALEPKPKITILGDGEGFEDVVKDFGLYWIPEIDTNFLGVPLFNSVFEAANASTADVVVLANADIMLFDDFGFVLRKLFRDMAQQPWLAIGARWDVDSFPDENVDTDKDETSGIARQTLLRHYRRPQPPPEPFRRRMVEWARRNGTLHTYGGIDLWAWNTRAGVSMLNGPLPHFVFGRGKYDNWFTHEVISANRRAVVDVSDACTLTHVAHDHHLVAARLYHMGRGKGPRRSTSNKRAYWNHGAREKFELYINTYLAAAHGSYENQMGTILHAPYKLQGCYEREGICLLRRRRPNKCRCEYSPFVSKAMTDPFAVNHCRVIFCGLLSSESQQLLSEGSIEMGSDTLDRFVVSGRARAYGPSQGSIQDVSSRASKLRAQTRYLHGAVLENAAEIGGTLNKSEDFAFGLPMVLERLLEVIEHRTVSKQVVLTILNSSHKSLLMNFACAARAAGVFAHVVVAALDDELYHYAVTRGIAVYLEESVYTSESEEEQAMRLDSSSQAILIALRMRIMRRLLRLDRDVLYIDPDVFLLKNPFAHFIVPHESSAADVFFMTRPVNRRSPTDGTSVLSNNTIELSSGMIYATPNVRTFEFFDLAIDRARGKNHEIERIACSPPHGERTENGDCVGPGNAAISFFPQSEFVTLMDQERWRASREGRDAIAVHVRWPRDAQVKLDVMRQSDNLMAYDEIAEVCRRGSPR